MDMTGILFFIVGSIGIIYISLPSLLKPGSHGFYRFFAWEIIFGALLLNLPDWFKHPFTWYQVISWILLLTSLIPVTYGVILLRKVGKPSDELEATTKMVTTGIYKFIRHPLYASLIYLAWGIFFKSPSILDGCLAVVTTAFLYATARSDEAECLIKFGPAYSSYMKVTKRFIPYLY
jgi:protein-S-isoprenylcysteine O-methyltransferase Ste14